MRALACFLMLLFAIPNLSWAQSGEDDRGFITRLLEENLGGEGRSVRIDGFRGTLSRRATITQITIADDDGIWLTIRDVAMEWNRGALLRGQIDITTLSAAEIALARPPLSPDDGLPAPEASGFSLPDLPVGILIETLQVERISLGAAVLGVAAELTLTASARLDSAEASVDLEASRIDGETGRFVIDASFDRTAETAAIRLDLSEAEDGVVAGLLDIRDRPSMRLQVSGNGPLSNFVTDATLQTAGQERLSGRVTLAGTDVDTSGAVTRSFDVDVSGDLAPLFPEVYGAFFGNEVALTASGSRAPDGALDVPNFALVSGASELGGSVALSADQVPERVAVDGILATEDGTALTLPISGGQTQLTRATFDLQYDARVSEAWTTSMVITALETAEFSAETLQLVGTGEVRGAFDLEGEADLQAEGLAFASPEVSRALGETLAGRFDIRRRAEDDLQLSDIALEGSDYGLTGDVSVAGLEQEFASVLDLNLTARNLGRFSGLAGLDLAGSAALDVDGTVDLGGRFDLTLAGSAERLGLGIERVDPLLQGETVLRVTAKRDETGTRLPQVNLSNAQLTLKGDLELVTDASKAVFNLTVRDGTLIDPALDGPITLVGSANETSQGWQIDAKATGPYEATAAVRGAITGPSSPRLDFDAVLPDVSNLAPALSGALRSRGTAVLREAGWQLTAVFEGPYGATGAFDGRVSGELAPDVAFDVKLPDIAPFVPTYRGSLEVEGTAKASSEGILLATRLRGPYGSSGVVNGAITGQSPQITYRVSLPDVADLGAPFGGPLALNGTAREQSDAWIVNTSVSGPGGINARISGAVNGRSSVDLISRGTAPLGLANPFLEPRNLQGQAGFDLALRGALNLSSLSGTITANGASLSAPTLQNGLRGIEARVTIANGRATVSASGAVTSGGRIVANGDIGLNGSASSNIALQIQSVRLVDPDLYTTVLNGDLRVQGPLSGAALISGEINVGETEVQIPSSQAPGFTIIPQIVHVRASPAVRQTLRRAGLGGVAQASGGGVGSGFALNIRVNAPARIFVRGRGLDAELGGSLNLQGRTNRIVSSGGFQLIRGRLDLLGKRFALDQGRIDFQGQAEPYIRFVATSPIPSGSATIEIRGPASTPDVIFSSTPAAPEDEVLAQIFFGRGITELSAFQALQLASAVASLSGGRSETILSNLRKSFRVDDLDVTTSKAGDTELRIGKYLSDNVYTSVTVGDQSGSSVSLNVDLTPSVTARGTLQSDGNSSIGIFFERDY